MTDSSKNENTLSRETDLTASQSTRAGPKAALMVFHKGLILVFGPLLIQLALILALALVLLQLDAESARESRYRRCAAIGAHIVVLCNQAAIDLIGWFQTGNPEMMKAYDKAMDDLKIEETQLIELTRNDSLSKKSAGELIQSIQELSQMLNKIANLAKLQRLWEMAAVIPTIDKEFRSTKDTHLEHISAVTAAQKRIAEESTLRQEKLRLMQTQIIICGLIANVLLTLFLLFFFKRSISDRLQVVRENTRRLDEDRPLSEALTGKDEIWQLDLAFHRMAAEVKDATERERSLFNKASDVICVLNSENIFTRINPACLRHWGFKPDELNGKSITNVVAAKNAQNTGSLLRSARHGGDSALFELSLQKKDGTVTETLWSTYWSEQEELLFSVVHDISEQKRIERMKQSYLQIIGSDLRIPLSSIAEAAERLAGPLAKALSQRALERVEIVKSNLGRLLFLVNDLLEMSTLESGSLTLNKEVCAVEPLLKRACNDLEGLAQKHKVRFGIECQASDCLLDPNRIMQVLVNLASNAIKFSPEGGEIALLASSKEDFLEVKVSDQGRGVPDSHKQNIFEKFKQVEAADGKRQAGTGLGLPICKDIVAEHGGEIGVNSQEGKGSTFWFKLPLNAETYERVLEERRKQHVVTKPADSKGRFATVPANAPMQPAQRGADWENLTISEQNTMANGSLPNGSLPNGSFMSLTKKGILLIVLPLAVELVFVLSILGLISQANSSRQEELRQRQIAADSFDILDAYFKMIATITPSSSETLWLAFNECCHREQVLRKDLARLLKNDRTALRYFLQEEKVSKKLDAEIVDMRRIMDEKGYSNNLFDEIHPDRIVLIATTSGVSRRLFALVDEAERKQAVSPHEQARLRQQQGILLFAGLGINILLSLLLARFFEKNITTRLATLADNTVRLARNMSLNPLIPGNDEIAQLDRAFHASAEKLAEARRKELAVFDNSRDLIAALDENLRFASCNPAAERLLGYTKSELANKTVLEFVDAAEIEAFLELLSSSRLASGQTVETRIKRSDGSSACLLWSLSRPENEATTYCVAHDISARKQLELLKQEFLAVVSHDLRTPLGSVIGFITLIRAGAMGEPAPEAVGSLDQIIEEADNLLALINDLLDLEKLEAQGMQLITSRESAGMIAYMAFESVSARFPEFALELSESNVEINLDLDRERMTQAFSNIYTHILRRIQSAKAIIQGLVMNHEGMYRLLLSIREESGQVIWELVDPGPVYSQSEKLQLFERFKPDSDLRFASTGLALPIAKRIVEAHGTGASLRLRTEAGGQQVFVIRLPGFEKKD